MEIRHLQYFLAVAEEGSFNRAAARLLVSQPSLSRQLTAVEKQLGRQLFIRHVRGVRLTAEGELLLQHARQIIALERAIPEVVSGAAKAKESVVIGACPGLSETALSEVVLQVREKVPQCALTYLEANSSEQLRMVRVGGLDLGIVHQRPPRNYASWLLSRVPFGMAVRQEHRLSSREDFTVRDLDGLRVLVHSPLQVPVQQDGLLAAVAREGVHPLWQFASFAQYALPCAEAVDAEAVLVSSATAARQFQGWHWRPIVGLDADLATWLACQMQTRTVVQAVAKQVVEVLTLTKPGATALTS